jgi:molecular chaperone GrpE (heat shock protein)
VTQLVTQAHIAASGAAVVSAADVLTVGMRLVRSLEREGVRQVGAVGQIEPFDPGRHDPIEASAPALGAAVAVRFVGLCYQERVVRKAGVESVRA